jgi:hypothetical protein
MWVNNIRQKSSRNEESVFSIGDSSGYEGGNGKMESIQGNG